MFDEETIEEFEYAMAILMSLGMCAFIFAFTVRMLNVF